MPKCEIELFFLFFLQYSAETLGGHGNGGEYDVQIGFGWTNGVIIEYLAKYGENLTSFNWNWAT